MYAVKSDVQRKCVLGDMDEIMHEVPENEKIIIEGDLNVHNIKGRQKSERINGNWGFGERNKARKKILMFSEAYNLGIVNILLKRRDEHIIAYKSRRNKSQVDYLLVK